MTNPAAGFSMAFDKYGTVAATPYIPLDQRLEGPQGLTFRTAVQSEPMKVVERGGRVVEATRRTAWQRACRVQMTLGISDGGRLWAVRYSTQHRLAQPVRLTGPEPLPKLHPDNPRLQQLNDTDHASSRSRLATCQGTWLGGSASRTALLIAVGRARNRCRSGRSRS